MGAIAGIFSFSSLRVQGDDDQRAQFVLSSIAGAGANPTAFADAGFALGHLQSPTQTDGMSVLTKMVFAVEGRIDNRDDLTHRLALSSAAPDIEIVRAVFDQYGAHGLKMLRGPQTVVAFNRNERQLDIVRGPIGASPIYYWHSDDRFCFGSNVHAILKMADGHVFEPAQEVLEDYAMAQIRLSPEATGFKGVELLGPGHNVCVTPSGVEQSQHWQLAPKPATHDDLAEEFKARLETATRRCLRGARAVGSTMSGGLDSSSITCLLDKSDTLAFAKPLTVISSIFDGKNGPDERDYIAAVNDSLSANCEALLIDSSNEAAFENIIDRVTAHSRPLLMPNAAIGAHPVRAIAAHNPNINVLLHGHGGDEVVYSAPVILYELAQNGQYKTLWNELKLGGVRANQSRFNLFLYLCFSMSPLGQIGRKVRQRVGPRSKNQALSLPDGSAYWAPTLRARYLNDPVFHQRFSGAALPPTAAHLSLSQKEHYRTLLDPLQSYGMDALYHEHARAGLEVRYPFWDTELVEFCLGLPGARKWKNGQNRAILREAMTGILPEKIARRTDKFEFNGYLARSMRNKGGLEVMADAIIDKRADLEPYFDMSAIARQFETFAKTDETPEGYALIALWRATILSIWLDQYRAK